MIGNQIRESLQKVSSMLNKHEVDYIIVGGVAVGYYGYTRVSIITTQKPELKTDLDFWYRPTLANFTKLTNALIELGIDSGQLEQIVFDPNRTFLKIPHKNFHTDFLCQMQGLDSYQDCKANAEQFELDGNKFYILSYHDLLKNKMAVNRLVDKTDFNELEKIRQNRGDGLKP